MCNSHPPGLTGELVYVSVTLPSHLLGRVLGIELLYFLDQLAVSADY